MTVNQKIMAALKSVGLPVEMDVYTDKNPAYLTFNYDLIPAQWAGRKPLFWRALIQVHLFCPLTADFSHWRSGVLSGLAGAGFPCPEIMDATDEDARHLVFETEIITKMEV